MTFEERLNKVVEENQRMQDEFGKMKEDFADLQKKVAWVATQTNTLLLDNEEVKATLTDVNTTQSIFTLVSMGVTLPGEELAKATNIIAEQAKLTSPEDNQNWKDKTFYTGSTLVMYSGKRYMCLLAHISQADWTPDKVVSLWTEHKEAYAEWVRPTGAHDAYRTGDKVSYKSKKYECIMDYNTYSPDEYPQGWKIIN